MLLKPVFTAEIPVVVHKNNCC